MGRAAIPVGAVVMVTQRTAYHYTKRGSWGVVRESRRIHHDWEYLIDWHRITHAPDWWERGRLIDDTDPNTEWWIHEIHLLVLGTKPPTPMTPEEFETYANVLVRLHESALPGD